MSKVSIYKDSELGVCLVFMPDGTLLPRQIGLTVYDYPNESYLEVEFLFAKRGETDYTILDGRVFFNDIEIPGQYELRFVQDHVPDGSDGSPYFEEWSIRFKDWDFRNA